MHKHERRADYCRIEFFSAFSKYSCEMIKTPKIAGRCVYKSDSGPESCDIFQTQARIDECKYKALNRDYLMLRRYDAKNMPCEILKDPDFVAKCYERKAYFLFDYDICEAPRMNKDNIYDCKMTVSNTSPHYYYCEEFDDSENKEKCYNHFLKKSNHPLKTSFLEYYRKNIAPLYKKGDYKKGYLYLARTDAGIKKKVDRKLLSEEVCMNSFGLKPISHSKYAHRTYERNDCLDKLFGNRPVRKHPRTDEPNPNALKCGKYTENFKEACLNSRFGLPE